jgi:putative ABC transport system permease protein
MVVLEVALALLLVAGAGLLVRTSLALREVDPGCRTENRLAFQRSLPGSSYPDAASVIAFYDALDARVEALPGVESVALTSRLPLDGANWSSDFSVAGRGPDDYGSEVWHREVDADYFRTMGVPVVRGRAFTDGDRADGEKVIVINEELARRFFADEDPVGQRISFDKVPDAGSTWRRIVGVVGDELHEGLDAPPRIEIIAPIRQDARGFASLVVQTRTDPHAVLPAVRSIIAELDRDLPIARVRTLDEVYSAALAPGRFLLTLLAVFASIALLLAAIGVYGVTSQAARRRTQEIGIRVALGAEGADVVRLIVRQGMGVVLAGTGLGLAAGLAGARLMQGVIYGVPPTDAVTFIVVPALLVLVAAVACWIPARRATRLDPLRALRVE